MSPLQCKLSSPRLPFPSSKLPLLETGLHRNLVNDYHLVHPTNLLRILLQPNSPLRLYLLHHLSRTLCDSNSPRSGVLLPTLSSLSSFSLPVHGFFWSCPCCPRHETQLGTWRVSRRSGIGDFHGVSIRSGCWSLCRTCAGTLVAGWLRSCGSQPSDFSCLCFDWCTVAFYSH